MKTFDTVRELASSEYLFRIQDNGGDSADRYTVAFSDGDYLAMSGSPSHPQGVSLSGEDLDPQVLQESHENGRGIDMAMGDLPQNLQEHILFRVNQGFQDYLAFMQDQVDGKLKPGTPHPIAVCRDDAEPNDGQPSSVGKGIYMSGDAFWVRMDCMDSSDDRGPCNDVAQALRDTLPDPHSLAGEEYHSTVDVARMEPSDQVASAIRELEAKVDREWKEANPSSFFGR